MNSDMTEHEASCLLMLVVGGMIPVAVLLSVALSFLSDLFRKRP